MGVDYRSVISYGKEFDSFGDALTYLLEGGIISEETYDDSLDSGEIIDETLDLTFVVYNAYSGGYGILGSEFSAKTLYTCKDIVAATTANVDAVLGSGCQLHEFVQVY